MDMNSIVMVLQAMLVVAVLGSIAAGLVALRNDLRHSRRRRLLDDSFDLLAGHDGPLPVADAAGITD